MACVYISHKLDEVAAVCDTISVIRDGKHIATTAMAEMDIPKIITQMVGREMSNLYPTEAHDIGEVIFEARNITCYDVDNPRRKRVDDISFVLKRGEILGIAGLVGAGRTELVSALFGAYPGRYSGEVWLDGQPVDTRTPLKSIRAGLCMVPEDRKRQGIIPDMGVGQNITLAVLDSYSKMTRIDAEEAELGSIDREISRMHLKTASPFLPITSLSGGNQQKAVLAKMLLTRPRVLILDEPTRGVDVGAKYEIYKLMGALAAEGVAIIMVSSELAEVLGVSDRVLVIGEGRLCGDFINHELTQEQVLAAALSHPGDPDSNDPDNNNHNDNDRKTA
ncbi:Xylose import ATP-binding protein XylG [Pseudomonas syringae pv. actinidiae]|nr:Xylose import ATP-binding protein XylG [Pseudomonas syringae pv. actinidiae]OSN76447.1 Xylose import ATP-binding protein XylG [Pseudomonas syringae pv. actinidiae]